ncbi:MAG: hypothetical protein FWF46_00875 [Oscillospiraceae bacterium]|nr:hypothetical protein [Oscillospiraceae bacterium]
MNNKYVFISAIAMIVIFIIYLIIRIIIDNSGPYPKSGRDTHDYFGDARFVILDGVDFDYKATWTLYDQKNNTAVEESVYNYKKVRDYVYAIGSMGYTKLNYKIGEYTQNKDISIFSDNDKKIFSDLEATKDKVVIK